MKIRDLANGRGAETFYLDLDSIIVDEGYNVRKLDTPEVISHIRQMADSIKANGVLSFPPVGVFKDSEDKIHLVTGHCRLAAHKIAASEGCELRGILAIANTMNEEARTVDLLLSNSGLPLTQLEQAEAVKRLLAFGWSQAEVARRLGKSQTAIANLVAILEAPESVKEMVQKGEISATLVSEEMKAGPEKAEDRITKAVKKAKDQGKKKATKKDIEEDIVAAKSCPHCGEALLEIAGEGEFEHTLNGCFNEGIAFGLDKLALWNKRSK